MNCNDILMKLDEFCQDELSAEQSRALQHHVDQCKTCREIVGEHREYLARMIAFEAPQTAAGTNARLLRQARDIAESREVRAGRQSSFMQGFAAASLVACALFFGYQALLKEHEPGVQATVAGWPRDWVEREVTVVINVPADLPGAQLALEMPEALRLQGFAELGRLSWQLDLKKGANTLTLPITVQPGTDLSQPMFITATLGYQNKYKGFQLPVELKTPQTRKQDAQTSDANLLQSHV